MTRQTANNLISFTTTEVRRNLTAIVQQLRKKQKPAFIKRGGESVAVLMSMPEYEKLLRYQKLAEFQKMARAIGRDVEKSGLTEEQLMEELEETKREVFRERYGSL
jgi:PHD/YefM family antitoxin component YafN of YafNO toxin-antitoxin module